MELSKIVSVLVLSAATLLAQPSESLPVSTPEEQGVSSPALLAFVSSLEQHVDAVHSFVLVRHGHVVAKGGWDPYTTSEPHQLFSLSKSFTAVAVGLAIAERRLSVNDTVLSFFPEKAPTERSENLKALRVRDLLRMTTGHHNEAIEKFPFFANEDLVARFLELPIAHKPGTFFVYNTPATFMLSAIVQEVTGQTVLDYLRPRLLEPLGIHGATWMQTRGGISVGGFGLSLAADDIAKFGQLLLQRGSWQGRQLIPSSWVDEATAMQTSNGSAPDSDWDQGYGYQFWRSRHGFYRADGAHGQFCIVMPQYDAVLAVTSGTRDMAKVMNVTWEKLIPAFQPTALQTDSTGHRALQEKLTRLQLRVPQGTAVPDAAFVNRAFVFPPNPLKLEKLTLLPSTDQKTVRFELRIGGKTQELVCGLGYWHKGELDFDSDPDVIASAAAWTSPTTCAFTLYRYRSPIGIINELQFHPDKVVLDGRVNVAGAGQQLIGTPADATAPSALDPR